VSLSLSLSHLVYAATAGEEVLNVKVKGRHFEGVSILGFSNMFYCE
jgi:hypothetical protein